jgi:hypothetical protein
MPITKPKVRERLDNQGMSSLKKLINDVNDKADSTLPFPDAGTGGTDSKNTNNQNTGPGNQDANLPFPDAGIGGVSNQNADATTTDNQNAGTGNQDENLPFPDAGTGEAVPGNQDANLPFPDAGTGDTGTGQEANLSLDLTQIGDIYVLKKIYSITGSLLKYTDDALMYYNNPKELKQIKEQLVMLREKFILLSSNISKFMDKLPDIINNYRLYIHLLSKILSENYPLE